MQRFEFLKEKKIKRLAIFLSFDFVRSIHYLKLAIFTDLIQQFFNQQFSKHSKFDYDYALSLKCHSDSQI
jgi:hypothetical protein